MIDKKVNKEVPFNYFNVVGFDEKFSSSKLIKLSLQNGITIKNDNFKKNNPNVKKLLFSSDFDISETIYHQYSNTEIYSLPYINDYSSLIGYEFDLTTKDFKYLYPNIIYMNNINSYDEVAFIDDIDNEDFTTPVLKNANYQFKGWFLDKECTNLFEKSNILEKEIYTNSDNHSIYVYKPLIVYAGWESEVNE